MSFVFLGYLVNVYITKRDAGQKGMSGHESIEKCMQNDFKVIDIQWPKEGQLDLGIIKSMTITNTGDHDCTDMRGVIRFISNEGTELDKIDFSISENIRSKETKTFKNIPLKQHTSTNANNASVTIWGTRFYPEKE
jgi:hypothetical protein